jgi:hypothetical protein
MSHFYLNHRGTESERARERGERRAEGDRARECAQKELELARGQARLSVRERGRERERELPI